MSLTSHIWNFLQHQQVRSKMKNAKHWLLLLLLGMGDGLRIHVVGLIALSELVVFPLAPFLYLKNRRMFTEAGFSTFYMLVFLMIIGALVSTWYNNTWYFACLKHCATLYSIFAYSVVLFLLLKDDFKGIGWLFLGTFLASIIVIWGFNTAIHMDESIGTAEFASSNAEEVMSGVRFWSTRVSSILRLPIVTSEYLKLPLAYPLIALPAAVCVCAAMSISGRSDAAILLAAFALIAIAGKSRKRMMLFGRHFVIFVISVMVAAVVVKNLYKYAATKGVLGEAAKVKYLAQAKQGESLLRILMAGRGEFFIGMRAVLDKPFVGFGAMAEDSRGYWADFIWNYGDIDDYNFFMRMNEIRLRYGDRLRIPVHSYIVGFWGQSGIVGLVFSVYIFYLVYIFFRRYACAIPQWYGYFACTLPWLMWSMLFSPYGHGINGPMLFTALIMARAVGERRLQLPVEFEIEARKHQ